MVEGPTEQLEPRAPELRLEAEPPSRPLRRRPHEGEHDGADEENLAPEDLGRIHGDGRSGGRLWQAQARIEDARVQG